MTRRVFFNHIFSAIFVILTSVYWPVKAQVEPPDEIATEIGRTPGPLSKRSIVPKPEAEGWRKLPYRDKYGIQWYVKSY